MHNIGEALALVRLIVLMAIPVVVISPLQVETIHNVRVTAYAPYDNVSGMCADEDPSVTSIGETPGPDWCAVDPERIPYGTNLRIPGYGDTTAGDTGGALRSSDEICIDVYFDTYEEAMAWGVQYLDVIILKED